MPPSKTLPHHYIPGRQQLAVSESIFSWAEKGVWGGGGGGLEDYGAEKVTKINKSIGHWVLINSTIFATFTFLVYVLLYNNLASNMLQCEGSLT